MGLFDIFSKKTPNNAPHYVPSHVPQQSTQGIPYDPQLINGFLKDHKELFAIFGKIASDHQNKKYDDVANDLESFKRALQKHLLLENVKLYIYLENGLRKDSATVDIVRGFHHEMDGIGRVVMGFIDKYKDIAKQETLRNAFDEDIAAIGSALTDRVGREEDTLYPLYMPKY